MNENNFDEMLQNALPELPPADVVHEVTPWRKAMNRILTGMALCTITLNFLELDYLLPTIGMFLLLLGFRTLRSENGWFKGCWVLTLLRTVCHFSVIILNATIYKSAVYNSAIGGALNIVSPALQFLLIFCLWRAIVAMQKKAGTPVQGGSAAALLAWYAVAILLALVQYKGLILFLMMIVCYILILRSLSRLSAEMAESGYAVKASSVQLSDRNLVRVLASVLVAGIVCGYLFFGSYNMDWRVEDTTQNAEITEVKGELLTLGYPKAALNDLSGEDILACKGAVRIVAQEHDKPVREFDGNTTKIKPVNDVKELHFTDVAVELPGKPPKCKIFHHFLWTVNPGFVGTEALQLLTDYPDNQGWAAAGNLTGRVLYDKNGTVYTAPFHSLTAENYTSNSILWGQRNTMDIFPTFSMPRSGERQRGYFSYGIVEKHEDWVGNACVNYVHQKGILQYPVLTAEEEAKNYGLNDAHSFITVQDALQFYVTKDGINLDS